MTVTSAPQGRVNVGSMITQPTQGRFFIREGCRGAFVPLEKPLKICEFIGLTIGESVCMIYNFAFEYFIKIQKRNNNVHLHVFKQEFFYAASSITLSVQNRCNFAILLRHRKQRANLNIHCPHVSVY